jgi:hypothetical protein
VGHDRDAEVVVVNATAYEFLDWLKSDNLTEGKGRGRLRAGMLVKTEHASAGATPPCMVYLTDIAFPGGRKGQWFQRLADDGIRQGGLTVVLPPFCVSTGIQDDAQSWVTNGEAWSKAAERAPAPVIVLGPSPRANRAGDRFETMVPAGYLLAAHLLAGPDQAIRIESVARRSQGRFRVIGAGTAAMRDSLETVLWGEHDQDDYFFAVDFYLYLVLLLHATAARYGGMSDVPVSSLYACFHLAETVLDKARWKSSAILDKAVLGGETLRFWMDQNPGKDGTPLASVTALVNGKPRAVRSTEWFNAARRQAGL